MSSASVFHICISTWRHTIRAILSLVARVCSAKRTSLSLARCFATSVAASKRHYGVARIPAPRQTAPDWESGWAQVQPSSQLTVTARQPGDVEAWSARLVVLAYESDLVSPRVRST